MATKTIAWQTGSGNITLTYQGQGDGPISVVSDVNNGNARSQTITIQTTKGGVITKNVTVSQGACPFPVGDVKNFSYSGSYQEVELPAGQYKLQCWGAQGGSNGTNSTYDITAKAGGKGGYSEGIITLSQKTTVRVYVGGQGSASAGGFNGGGSTPGTSQYNSGNEFGYSKMGGGGGATDIRLSDGALLSRMIVAGGGSGGAMCYKAVTTTIYSWETKINISVTASGWTHVHRSSDNVDYIYTTFGSGSSGTYFDYGKKVRITYTGSHTINSIELDYYSGTSYKGNSTISNGGEVTIPNKGQNSITLVIFGVAGAGDISSGTVKIENQTSSSSTSTYTNSQVGYVGGGTNGEGYSSTYCGKQNGAGSNGSFGQGANQTPTNTRYCSSAGGGGWYGGGCNSGDSDISRLNMSGGGSGFVNTAASAGNRPSGYTGLQLDSGSTTAGSSSFPAPGGGNETGHAGNGYARITRLS